MFFITQTCYHSGPPIHLLPNLAPVSNWSCQEMNPANHSCLKCCLWKTHIHKEHISPITHQLPFFVLDSPISSNFFPGNATTELSSFPQVIPLSSGRSSKDGSLRFQQEVLSATNTATLPHPTHYAIPTHHYTM